MHGENRFYPMIKQARHRQWSICTYTLRSNAFYIPPHSCSCTSSMHGPLAGKLEQPSVCDDASAACRSDDWEAGSLEAGSLEAGSLLDLPQECLLAVLQCCADDHRSLFSAARTHSMLHQAAAHVAVSSIRVVVPQQQLADNIVQYLSTRGQHVGSLDLEAANWEVRPTLHQLPHKMLHELTSLKFNKMALQLQPGGGFQGVLGAGMPLQQLELECCSLQGGSADLASALAQLPKLQHLKFVHNMQPWLPPRHRERFSFSSSALEGLQPAELTYLELRVDRLKEPEAILCRQQLQRLTRLQNLQFDSNAVPVVRASMLSGMSQLTCLKANYVQPSYPNNMKTIFQAEALAGMTQLQHLEVTSYHRIVTGQIRFMQDGTAELLSHLGSLQQLTYLHLDLSLYAPSEAFTALTASTKLQHLNIHSTRQLGGSWKYILPAGRQLPHLTALQFPPLEDPDDLEGSTLVSCCPGLQSLSMPWKCNAELLASLAGLSSLQELRLEPSRKGALPGGLETVRRLTGLKRLHLGSLTNHDDAEGFPLKLTELQQLTYLEFNDRHDRVGAPHWQCYLKQAPLPLPYQKFMLWFICEIAGDEPVWRQVLQCSLDHNNLGPPHQETEVSAE